MDFKRVDLSSSSIIWDWYGCYNHKNWKDCIIHIKTNCHKVLMSFPLYKGSYCTKP